MTLQLTTRHAEHRHLLAVAAKVLGEPVRPVTMDWDTHELAKKRLRLIERRGLDATPPVVRLSQQEPSESLDLGLNHYQLAVDPPAAPIDLVEFVGCSGNRCFSPYYDIWTVRQSQYQQLLAQLRRTARRAVRQTPPVLPAEIEQQLLDNTIGFLQRESQTLARYGVAQKRGVLLSGAPGNGKTMACRWLRWHCKQLRLGWRAVTAEDFEDALGRGVAGEVFQLPRPGIIQFDDFDHYFRDRSRYGTDRQQTALLQQLDGLNVRRGVVYLFTTNAKQSEMDPAFRRPGRIDRFLEFKPPDAALRQRLIETVWHGDIRAHLDVPAVVARTAGLSFAELEELKKLLVLNFLDGGSWDWSRAWETFQRGREESRTHTPIGFHRAPERSEIPAASISATR